MLKRAVLTFLMLFSFSFLTLKSASSFFVSTAVSSNNTFSTAEEFPSVTPSTTISPTPNEEENSHLVINEVSMLGNGDEEWVELYNPTSNEINLSGWIIEDNTGSDPLPSVILPAGGYGVIVSGDSTVSVPLGAIEIKLNGGASPNSIGGGLNSTGDSVEILNSTVSIDAMNYGTNTDHFIGGPAIPSVGTTVSRIPNGTDTNTGVDWQTNTSSTIGVSNNP